MLKKCTAVLCLCFLFSCQTNNTASSDLNSNSDSQSNTVSSLNPEEFTTSVTLNVLAYGLEDNNYGIFWKEAVKQFKTLYPNIKIKYDILFGREYYNELDKRINGRKTPDIAYFASDMRWSGLWSDSAQQYNHSPFLDPSFYNMEFIPPMGPNGEIYHVPLGAPAITSVLYINTKLITSLGFKIPQSYYELIAMTPKAKELGIDVINIAGAEDWVWSTCLLSTLIGRFSGDPHWISKAVNREYKFSDQVFIDSLKFIKRMVKEGVINKRTLTYTRETSLERFNSGKSLFLLSGHWDTAGISSSASENTIINPLPRIPGENKEMAGSAAGTVQMGYGLTKSGAKNEKKRDAALIFFQFLNDQESSLFRMKNHLITNPLSLIVSVPDDLPVLVQQKSQMAQTSIISDVMDIFLDQVFNRILNSGLKELVIGKTSPEKIARELDFLLSGLNAE